MTWCLLTDVMLEEFEDLGVYPRELGVLDMAFKRPASRVYGAEVYPTIWQKAAAQTESLITWKPMLDNNRKAAWHALNIFLAANQHWVAATRDDAEVFCQAIESGSLSLADAAAWIASRSLPRAR